MVAADRRAVRASLKSPRSRRPVNASRHDEILAAAGTVFFEKGFTQVGIDQLCAELRCSKATLYAVAGSKEHLVLRVTRRFFASSAAAIEEAVDEEHGASRRIKTYLGGVGEAMGTMSTQFYDDMVAFMPTADIYQRNADAAVRRVQKFIAEGIEQGEFRAVHGDFAAQLIAWAIQGIQGGELLQNTGMNAGQAFSELADLVLNGLHQ